MNLTVKEKQRIAEDRRQTLASHLNEAAAQARAGNWQGLYQCLERASEALKHAEEAK